MNEFNLVKWITDTFGISPLAKNSPPEPDSIGFIKDASGKHTKWIGVYSNSFRDDDVVPEILTSDGHKKFVNEVDAGNYRLPELWLWHQPEWRLGKASFVAVDEVEDGVTFAIAGGDIDPGKEHVAKAMDESGVDWRMSHTFYSNNRNDQDDSYDSFYVEEVSPLPASVEANPLTGFGLLEGNKMIDPKKREAMQELLGVDEKFLDDLEATNVGVANMAKEEREHKAKDTEETTEEVTTEVGTTETVVEEEVGDVTEETTSETESTEEVDETTDDDGQDVGAVDEETESTSDEGEQEPEQPDLMGFVDMLSTSIKAVMTGMEAVNLKLDSVQADVETLKPLSADVAALKEAAGTTKETEEEEQPQTLASMLNYKSIIGNALDAQVKEGDELEEAGPEETEEDTTKELYGEFLGGLIKGARPS